jgi:hypothetical protein
MFEYILPFLPMLAGFSFHSVGLDFVAMGILALITIGQKNYKIKILRTLYPFILFFSYAILKDIIIILFGPSDTSESFHKLIAMLAYMAVFIVLASRAFDQKKFYKGLKFASTFYMVGLVYHLVLIYVFNLPAKGISIIPGYQFTNENQLNRPRSFFSEPAILATAMLPILFYSLYKKDYKWAIPATITIILSTSTTGVILACVLWVIQFLFSKNIKGQYKISIVIFMSVIAAFFWQWQFSIDAVRKVRDTLSGGGSTSVRVFLGFDLIHYMNPAYWVFGSLYNVPYDYAAQSIGLFPTGSYIRHIVELGSGQFFINTFCLIIFRYGLVGMILYFNVYKKKILNCEYTGQAFAIMTIVETVGDTMLLNSYYFFVMLMLVMLEKEGKEKVHEGNAYRVRSWKPNAGLL